MKEVIVEGQTIQISKLEHYVKELQEKLAIANKQLSS